MQYLGHTYNTKKKVIVYLKFKFSLAIAVFGFCYFAKSSNSIQNAWLWDNLSVFSGVIYKSAL